MKNKGDRPMICIPIMAKNTDEAITKMARADTLAEIVEIRLDVMEKWDLRTLMRSASKPVLVTYRSKKEGGNGSVGYETRVRYLREAINGGADLVDVEFSSPLEYRKALMQNRRSSKIVLSLHLRNNTPSRERLERVFKQMAATGADIVKIVTWARSWEDNFRVLELIPRAHSIGTEIMAFCMGPLGRISRIASPLMGGYMTFASLEGGEESASGQIPAPDMKRVLEMLSP